MRSAISTALLLTAGVLCAGTYEWSPQDGGCVFGEGVGAVSVKLEDGALSFSGNAPSTVYLGRFLPCETTGEWATVLKGVRLSDVAVYSTKYYNPSAHPGLAVGQAIDGIAFPSGIEYHDDGSVTMALMLFDSVYTKGTMLRLKQDGDDVVGQVVWAKFASGDLLGREMDFSSSVWRTMDVASETKPTNSYGIDQLTFVYRGSARPARVNVSSVPEGVTKLSVSGGVEVVCREGAFAPSGGTMPAEMSVFDAKLTLETGAEPVVSTSSFTGAYGDVSFVPSGELPELHCQTGMVFTTVETDCIFRNIRLADVTNAVGWMSGLNLSPSPGYHVSGFFFENDGLTASCQFQYEGGNYIKCVLLEMKQVGRDVHVWTPAARFIDFTRPEYSAYDDVGLFRFTRYNGSGGATVTSGAGYCISNLVLQGHSASSSLYLEGGSFADTLRPSFGGTEEGKLIAVATASQIFPKSKEVRVEIAANATLAIGASMHDFAEYLVLPGGCIDNCANWSLNPYQDVLLDGGSIRFGTAGVTYARRITYLDGAESSGTELRMGDRVSGTIVASGNAPSRADMDFCLYAPAARTFLFAVDDVTGSSEPDFTVEGWIYHATAADTNSTVVKTGPGTMRWNGPFSAVGLPTALREGTLLLGDSDVMSASGALSFEGGALAVSDGSRNACGEIFVSADTSLEIGSGAELSFASVGSWDEDARLDVTAGKNARLRIGSSAELTAGQLSRIRINGRRVRQDGTGEVSIRPRGSFIVLR